MNRRGEYENQPDARPPRPLDPHNAKQRNLRACVQTESRKNAKRIHLLRAEPYVNDSLYLVWYQEKACLSIVLNKVLKMANRQPGPYISIFCRSIVDEATGNCIYRTSLYSMYNFNEAEDDQEGCRDRATDDTTTMAE